MLLHTSFVYLFSSTGSTESLLQLTFSSISPLHCPSTLSAIGIISISKTSLNPFRLFLDYVSSRRYVGFLMFYPVFVSGLACFI